MRSRYRVQELQAPHFVISTIVGCQIVVDALAYCRANKGLKVHGWVILDNHLHAILAASDLPRVMADFKRHTARRLIELLEAEKCDWLLHLLRQWRAGHKAESEFQVWQEATIRRR